MVVVPRARVDTLAHCALLKIPDHSVVSSYTEKQRALPIVYLRDASISDSLVDLSLVIPCIQ
jgi:hypothetical protein